MYLLEHGGAANFLGDGPGMGNQIRSNSWFISLQRDQ